MDVYDSNVLALLKKNIKGTLMKKYDIVHSHMRLDLITQVNAELALGWELHGPLILGPVYDAEGNSTSVDYLQPMVKELTELEIIDGRK